MSQVYSFTSTWDYGTLIDKSLSKAEKNEKASVTLGSDSKFLIAIAPIKQYKARIKSATLSMTISGSLMTCGYTVTLNGTTLVSKSSGLLSAGTTISKDITSFVETGTDNPGYIPGDLYVSIGSGISSKYCKNVKIIFDLEYTLYEQKFWCEPSDAGTISGFTTSADDPQMAMVTLGQTITRYAYPNSGYKFSKWSDGSTSAEKSYTVTGDASYIAYFEPKPPEITSVEMLYSDKQISSTNKVPAGQSFVIKVGIAE